MIYKTFFGQHIDLSRLIAISQVRFLDHMGSGGYYVTFQMEFQLMDRPLVFTRELTIKENPWVEDGNNSYSILMTDGTVFNKQHDNIDESKIQAVVNLQKEVNLIITAWEDSKK